MREMKERTIRLQNKLSFAFLSIFVLMLVAVSCSEREAYYKFGEIKDGSWAAEDALLFIIDSTDLDNNKRYDVSVEITNNVDYPYQNLWLFSEYNKEDSSIVKAQKEFMLADEFGKWQGSGFASLYQSSFPVLRSVRFAKGVKYQIHIRHGMQDTILHGIEKIGLKITEAEN